MTSQFPAYSGPAGAAFRLHAPARFDAALQHADGVVMVRMNAPYVSVALNFAPSSLMALHTTGWRVIQEALDVLAATRRRGIGTTRAHEYILWSLGAKGYKLTIGDFDESRIQLNASGSVQAPTPGTVGVAPVSTSSPSHHAAFRFLRMSLLTEDLFDSYRNAYLAFECLVSSISPKLTSEHEADWLIRVLNGPPAALGRVVAKQEIARIYRHGRLPLFHAKTGQPFQLPQGPKRMEIQAVLSALREDLYKLIHYVFGSAFQAGPMGLGFSPHVLDAMTRATFDIDEVVYVHEAGHESARPRVRIHTQRRFGNLWSSMEMKPPASACEVSSIRFKKGGDDRITLTFAESLPVKDLSGVRVELFQAITSPGADKVLYAT